MFDNRIQAGEQLAALLSEYKNTHAKVLALPRGGVPVGYVIARALKLPLEVFLVRKLGAPNQPELALGALTAGGLMVLNEELVDAFNISEAQLSEIAARENDVLKRRQSLYGKQFCTSEVKDFIVILVDDGIATGATIKAAIEALNGLQPKEIIVAVPVAAADSIAELRPMVHKVVCPNTPSPFYSVGTWYNEFPQITDEEVINLLEPSSG